MPDKIYTCIGLMSGTSMDGIDAAFIRTDGEKIYEIGPSYYSKFSNREQYKSVVNAAMNGAEQMAEADNYIARLHADAVNFLLNQTGTSVKHVDIIGFHGQTILHKPERGITIQLGNPHLLERLTNIKVISDFRRPDVAAGGQGAPLVPIYHLALWKWVRDQGMGDASISLPVAVLNIGGISNVTYISSKNPKNLLAFDCGIGNAPLDDFVNYKTGADYDENGNLAKSGTPENALIKSLLKDKFFTAPIPKSLDRDYFGWRKFQDLSASDGAATIVKFISEGVNQGCKFLPEKPQLWLVCGGGRKNPAIMKALADSLGNVQPIEYIEVDGDMVEAQAFGYLAVRKHLNLPISFKGTTGRAA